MTIGCLGSDPNHRGIFGLWSVYFAVMLASPGPVKRFREMEAAHVGGHGTVSLDLSYPELFRVTGPLQSIVWDLESTHLDFGLWSV